MSTVDVVAFGAHPDDVEIGMGATLAKLVAEGMRVAIVDLTDGEPTPFGDPETRARESARAAEILGVKERRSLTLRNRELADTQQSRRLVAETIRELRPRVLFVPYPVDAHPDHIAAASMCEAARFEAKYTKTDMRGEPFYPAKVIHYVAVHLRIHVEPSFVVDVTEHYEAKDASLRAYVSQFEANPANRGMFDRLRTQASYWGGMIGAEYGEPFFSREPVGVRQVTALL